MSIFLDNENKDFFRWGLGQADVMYMSAVLASIVCGQADVPQELKKQANSLLKSLFEQTHEERCKRNGVEFKVALESEGDLKTIIENWMPSDIKISNVNEKEGTFIIELNDINSILDIIREVGCTLKFDSLCEMPMISMKLD